LIKLLKDLDQGVADQVSLLKMLVIKKEEADQSYNRLRGSLNNGHMDQADR
jgi:hypothetical protein